MWTFDAPASLLLFFLVPLLIYMSHFRKARGGMIRFSFRVWNGQGFRTRFGPGRFLRIAAAVLFWAGFCLLVIGLAGPVYIVKHKIYLNRGIDIMIVLDESPSMLAQDFKPKHRFETAKIVIKDFIKKRENDQIGLISFSDRAYLRVPPTPDYNRLLDSLESLEIAGLTEGTAIGMGLSLAGYHLSHIKRAAAGVSGRVIILLTDGENNAGEIAPEIAADLARELGIKIYTIGLGKEGEAYMEVTDPETGKLIKGTYRGKFDEMLLRGIAADSGGQYFHARSPGTLTAIFERIDLMEKTEKRVRIRPERQPHHREFFILALMLILLDFLVRKGLLKEPV